MGTVDAFPGKWLPLGYNGERVIISTTENDVYNGDKYTYLDYKVVASSAYSIVTMLTASLEETTIEVSLETTKPGLWRMSEGAVVSGATTVTVFNNNRKSLKVYDSVIKTGGEIVSVGTIIGYHVVGSLTGGASKSGGSSSTRNAWVLKQNTTYMFSFLSDAADNSVVQGLYFTERTN